MEKTYRLFLDEVRSFLPAERIYTDELRRFAWGTDAGFYRKVPRIVLRSANEEEVSRILAAASRHRLPVTFRAAGTSLSGQAISDSILVVAGKNWEDYRVSKDAETIVLQPGIVGSKVNAILRPLGRKFGPDPASIGSAMVGGIVTNNASGMSCGTHANSDRTLVSARIVFADGTVLDTADAESRAAFRASHEAFIREIEALRDEVRADSDLAERIRYKYSIKNVTGLNLRPLVAYDDPFDIIAHLMVGSEGTLGFLSEVTMRTLPLLPFRASAMIYFKSITDAARAVVAMRKLKINAAELLDQRSLHAVGDTVGPEAKEGLRLHPDLTAVLTETEASSREELEANIASIVEALSPMDTYGPVRFTDEPEEYAAFWAVRSGIFPSVGGMRKEGTTCLIEDVAFHIEDLPQATADLSVLLDKHGYDDSCIYGHALEGNFHFIINQSFATETEVARYKAMILDVVEMVVKKYDGSLKAEHGTGRNMAPFVRLEWGEKAFGLMQWIKRLFDPQGLLNPGVVFNDNPDCYIQDFKALPPLAPPPGTEAAFAGSFARINQCIECGFCEVNCLSCGFTLSPRTRIAARREMTRLRADGSDPALLAALERQYLYEGDITCAGDGLCSMSCPMGINVSDLTHALRAERIPAGSAPYRIGDQVARHFSGAKEGVRGVLRLATVGQAVLGEKAMSAVGKGLHAAGLPLWTPATPKAVKVNPKKLQEGNAGNPLKVVYFPSCLNQTMGLTARHSPVHQPLVNEMTELLHKAGYDVIFPEKMEELCCGTIWESKGIHTVADRKVRELEEALRLASEDGRYPILCDQSPCLHRMRKCIPSLQLYEPATFIWEFLRERLVFTPDDTPVTVHQTCSMRLMKKEKIIVELAKLCSTNVFIPDGVGCCGFAGDKGLTHPEVNAYALRKLRPQLEKAGVRIGYSNSRTCEIGLTHNGGIPYVSIAYLVNAHSRAK